MKRITLLTTSIFTFLLSHAGKVSGSVTDTKGNSLAFASIIVKGSTRGVVANSQGRYAINLEPGTYNIVCQFVGYKAEEKKITVTAEDMTVNFQLSVQELKMDEVVIKRGEDPAIEIMKQTIKKRPYYNGQVDSFTVDVYIKGLLRSRSIPNKFMGQKIDREDMKKDGIDSLGKGILFLSESVTKVSFTKPDKIKYEVVSSKQSGGGYGLSFPFFINFYTNNVSVSSTNPRGFISPIADNAFHYYKFKYEGNFFEGNKMIDRIRVTPKRKNEPLFDGYIQIVDGEWRIHSLELTTTNEYQLELIDTLRITQMQAPVTDDVWRTQNQVVYVSVKKFGFDMAGNFLNVYSNYNLNPGFKKKYFNRIFMSYDSTATKKDSSYWASTRPVPLESDEKRDYVFKDSVSKAFRDSFSRRNIDSLRKIKKPVKFKSFFLGGVYRTHYATSGFATYKLNPLLPELEYNSVEGLAVSVVQSLNIRPRKGKNNYNLQWDARYGIANEHFNSFLTFDIRPRRESFRNQYLRFAGGKRVSQFNHENPIDPFTNSISTLVYKKNYIKLYENWFGTAEYNNRFENGLRWNINATYEDRIPLENATDFSFFKKDRILLPNHPYELADIPFVKHQAFTTALTLSFQPGQRYIQYPRMKVPIGSKYPTLELQYTKGIKDLFGSDVDFDKWKFTVYDELNLKIGGEFRYRVSAGGFLNKNSVAIPDFQHFNGNQTIRNYKYLNSFQLAPYYRYSNTESIYGLANVEHHFNGLLTNKIPLFNRLKWNLVAGSNTFYVNRHNYYVEAFAGLENIFKTLRVDFVTAYQAGPGNNFGIRIGLGGIIGNAVKFERN
jgi:hypothetical protein